MKTFAQFACETVNVAGRPAYKAIAQPGRRSYDGLTDWGWISPKGKVYRPPADKLTMSHLDIAIELVGYGARQALEKGYIRYLTFIGDDSELGFEFLDSKKARSSIVWYLHSLPFVHEVKIVADILVADDIDAPKESREFSSVKEAIIKLQASPILK